MRKIELLAPAKTADIGVEAIRHGADAVYIGAAHFGARAAAGNSVEDIERLVRYAHTFRAKVYVTVNTIFTDEELPLVEQLVWRLYDIGVDALIVQDFGLLKLDLPPIPLHASTQMDNRTAEKVAMLDSLGFEQVVLARELELAEIRDIHVKNPGVRLEAFVHGALCVSYSGRCYASEMCFQRSANRGECAQVCRMSFNLEDSNGKTILKDKHLLSLKDMCQLDALQDMLEAGVSSFKIEGRLKDLAYVKNVTAAYSSALNAICEAYPEQYERSSDGVVEYGFSPDVSKSFNRGFTHYFLHGRNGDIFSFDTPKSMGEEIGTVKDVYPNAFTISTDAVLSNGDGLCFVDGGKLYGFRVNKVVDGMVYPLEMPSRLRPRMRMFRNLDVAFEKKLSRPTAERYVAVDISLSESDKGFVLCMEDDSGCSVTLDFTCEKVLARSPQTMNIQTQLSKLGGTCLKVRSLKVGLKKNWFIPSSMLSKWRRSLCDAFEEERERFRPVSRRDGLRAKASEAAAVGGVMPYSSNVLNVKAENFYLEHGASGVVYAPESLRLADNRHHADYKNIALMTCKHCIRYSLGACLRNGRGGVKLDEPLFLRLSNNMRFRLAFDCKNCIMKLYRDA